MCSSLCRIDKPSYFNRKNNKKARPVGKCRFSFSLHDTQLKSWTMATAQVFTDILSHIFFIYHTNMKIRLIEIILQ